MSVEYYINITRYLLQGAVTTLGIWVITFAGSLPLAILLSMIKNLRIKPVNLLINGYSMLIRGTPLMFQLFFVYYGLPVLWQIRLDPWLAAGITFILNWTAYLVEIIKAGIDSVDKGQFQAAQVLGLTYWQTMRKIILPQALLRSLPSISNQAIEILYATPLLSSIGMEDILKNAKSFLSRDLRLDSFVIAALMYLVLNGLLITGFKKLEQKLSKFKNS